MKKLVITCSIFILIFYLTLASAVNTSINIDRYTNSITIDNQIMQIMQIGNIKYFEYKANDKLLLEITLNNRVAFISSSLEPIFIKENSIDFWIFKLYSGTTYTFDIPKDSSFILYYTDKSELRFLFS